MARLRMGMIGGGPGSFIGPVHRIAAEMDREIELVAGVFSSDPTRSREAGDGYRIDPARAYPNLETMFAAEKARPDGIDLVSIVSPNHHHFPAVKEALGCLGLALFLPLARAADRAALELECALKYPEQGGADRSLNKRLMGIG